VDQNGRQGRACVEPGEAADWLDRTVNVPMVSSRTLTEWIEEFRRLKKLNEPDPGQSGAEEDETEAQFADCRLV